MKCTLLRHADSIPRAHYATRVGQHHDLEQNPPLVSRSHLPHHCNSATRSRTDRSRDQAGWVARIRRCREQLTGKFHGEKARAVVHGRESRHRVQPRKIRRPSADELCCLLKLRWGRREHTAVSVMQLVPSIAPDTEDPISTF